MLHYLGIFLLTTLVIGILVSLARRYDWLLDHPDERKNHRHVTPLVGGVGIAAVLIPFMTVFGFDQQVAYLLLGTGVLVLVGVLDDFFNLPAIIRLAIQFLLAVIVVIWGGVQVENLGVIFGHEPQGLGLLSVPFSVLCIVFMINALNMLDGMDGLAGLTALVSVISLGLLGIFASMPGYAEWQFMMAAALCGFLVFNLRHPLLKQAKAFLGDSGSMVLGFWLAWSAMTLAQNSGGVVAPITIALVLIFPAADTLAVFLRRGMRGQNPMVADRGHLHHVLLHSGFTVSQALVILISTHLIWILLAFGLHLIGAPQWPQFILVALIVIGYIALLLHGRRIVRAYSRVSSRSRTA